MAGDRVSIPSGDIDLEGVLDLPAGEGPFPAVVVCHPHPLYGGDMNNNVVMAIVAGLTAGGVAALRFNFRGAGRSGGRHDNGKAEQDDVRAALTLAHGRIEIDAARVGLAGYSFGAGVAAAVADASIPALALVAPPIGGGRASAPSLAAYPGPVLLLAGDSDHVCPAPALRELAAPLGERATLKLVEGTDHFWGGYDRDLSAIVRDFFAGALVAPAAG